MSKKNNPLKKKGGAMAMNASRWRVVLFFALPTVLLYFYVCIMPMISSITTSVYDWDGFGPKKYIGLQKDLVEIVSPDERVIVETFLKLKNGGAVYFDTMSENLFNWSKKWI